MSGRIGKLLATALGVILLIYSATRSLDFISLTLPADRQILAWFGLAALDAGLIAWLLSYLYGSNGTWQRSIALMMVIIDFLGAVMFFTLDTLYNTGKAGLTTAMTSGAIQTAVLALSGVIALNIGATIAHHLLDPDTLRRQAEEEARAQIEDQSLALIKQNSRQLAAQVAPQVANAWRDGIVAEYGHKLKKTKALPTQEPELPTFEVDVPELPTSSTNPTTRRKSKG
jgi:hypothetical protein